MIGEAIDKLAGLISPAWGLQRMAARATMAQIQSFSGGTQGGYSSGKLNRLNKGRVGSSANENAIPAQEVQYIRWQSWSLFRDNPWAKKVVRSIISKVVGRGLTPNSQANHADGTPFTEFRQRAQELWAAMERVADFRGIPGRGGLCLSQMQRLLLQSVILSGDALLQFRPLDAKEQAARNAPIPLSLLIVDSSRLLEQSTFGSELDNGNQLFRGIELDQQFRRVAYHLQQYPIGYITPLPDETVRVPVDEMLHLFVEDDIDQMRGVPWFASAIMQMRDTGDYQYNELKASAMAACVVLGYRKPTGSTQKFGLQQPTGDDTEDVDGNPYTSIQPGMFVNLGHDGGLEGFNPSRPGANAEAFIQHMLRGVSAAFPGVKSSTVTGDYRNSSFSSEKAADNDTWPEVENLQNWFAELMQPVFEQFVTVAISQTDWFDGVITAQEFADQKHDLLHCKWQGPISRSINPEKDVQAAVGRIQGGLSSLQKECAALGEDWRSIIRDNAELLAELEKHDLPEEFGNQLLGIDAQDVTEDQAAEATDAQESTEDGALEDMPTPAKKQKGAANGKQTVAAS